MRLRFLHILQWVLVLSAWIFACAGLQAQTAIPAARIRILLGGMMQRPSSMALADLRSVHSGQHLFHGCTYEHRLDERYRIGAGAGMSWGRYGLRLNGTASDSSGTYLVSNVNWSRPVWYPFGGFSGLRAWRTDPFQFWMELARSFGKSINPEWEATLMLGAASPTGIYLTQYSDVPGISRSQGEPAMAVTEWGDAWHAMVGLALDRELPISARNKLTLGVEWRYSLDDYFRHELWSWPSTSYSQGKEQSVHFLWIGVRFGYRFTLG